MPKFLTIGYGDQAGYDRTVEPVRQAAHAHDAELKKRGALIGMVGSPTQVRNPDGQQIEVEEGAYRSSELPMAGVAIIEASSLAEAIDLVAKTPCAVAHGVVEVWPLV